MDWVKSILPILSYYFTDDRNSDLDDGKFLALFLVYKWALLAGSRVSQLAHELDKLCPGLVPTTLMSRSS